MAALTERMNVSQDAMSLKGKTILITRQREQSEEFVAEIEKRGGRAVVIPMIRISDPENWHECDKALEGLAAYDAIVFASANAAVKFCRRVLEKNMKLSQFTQLDIYAVGEKTKEEIERQSVAVKFVPEEFSAEALSDFFRKQGVKGKRFLLPRGNLGKQELATTLTECGASVDSVVVYTNSCPDESATKELKDRFLRNEFDVVTFASPSAVKNFAAVISSPMFAKIQASTKIAVIGPTTREAALNLNFSVDIEAKESTTQGLAEAIGDCYATLNPQP